MQRGSAVPTLNFLILAFAGDNPPGLFAMAAKTVVTQRLGLILSKFRSCEETQVIFPHQQNQCSAAG